MPTVPIKRGDVVEVDLSGAIGAEKQGKRPCVVVQNNGGNNGSPLTIVAPITDRRAYKGYAQQVQVEAAELGPTGKDSVIECGHIRTIDRDSRINAQTGVTATLSDETMKQVDLALRASLGL